MRSTGSGACRLQQLQNVGSVVAAHGLYSMDSVVVAHGLSCSAAWGIFPDQGSKLSPALTGGFFTAEPPRKLRHLLLIFQMLSLPFSVLCLSLSQTLEKVNHSRVATGGPTLVCSAELTWRALAFRQRNQRSNCQHPLNHGKSNRVPEKHLFLLY